jgi:hypothetical protein
VDGILNRFFGGASIILAVLVNPHPYLDNELSKRHWVPLKYYLSL